VRDTKENGMTMLTELLRTEEFDTTEPATFYVPGATGWDDRELVEKMKASFNPSDEGWDE
jgi:hypothetical protein